MSNTPVVVKSSAIKLIAELLKNDVHVLAYDPLAIDNTENFFFSSVEYVKSAEACLEQAGLSLLTLNNAEIKNAVENFTPTIP